MRAARSCPVLVLALLSLAVGCGGSTGPAAPSPSAGTPTSESPSVSPSASPSVSPSPVTASAVSAYLLKAEQVQPVARVAHGAGVAAEAVRGLLAGPTAAERAGGLTTAVPGGTRLLGLTIRGGLATVDLSGGFGSGGGSSSLTARVAQVVFTLTQFPTVQRVSFQLDGRAVSSLGGEGVDVSAVTRDDYDSLSPAVLVERPRWSASVSAPLRVTGTAEVFEAVFFLEVRDSADRVLVTRRVMAPMVSGPRGAFDVQLAFAAPASGTGTLVAFTRTAKDGSRHEEVRVPLRFVAR